MVGGNAATRGEARGESDWVRLSVVANVSVPCSLSREFQRSDFAEPLIPVC